MGKLETIIFNKFQIMRLANHLLILILFLFFFTGCEALTSQAKGQISNLRCENATGIVNGQLDYGINVIFNVKNIGKSGVISIKAKLSTSEGEWQQEQNLDFNAGESKTLKYFFAEPTINVNNMQCKISIFPEAN